MDTPRDNDAPLYVPEELQALHLEEARRTVAASRGPRALARRAGAALHSRAGRSLREQFDVLAIFLHALAATVAGAFAAVTGTWLVGGFVVVAIGVSLVAVLRLLRVIERVHRAEATSQHQRH